MTTLVLQLGLSKVCMALWFTATDLHTSRERGLNTVVI